MRSASVLLSLSAFTFVALASGRARADSACPPGSWFCQPDAPPTAPVQARGANTQAVADPIPVAPAQAAPPSAPAATPPALPPPDAQAARPLPPPYAPGPYPPAPPAQVQVEPVPRPVPPPYDYTPREDYPRRREWGMNLHLFGVMMDSGRRDNTAMGGVGAGLRYRAIPALAFGADLDFASGRDYNGYRRSETAFLANVYVYLNPQSKVAAYVLGGVGWAGAKATERGNANRDHRYAYFGGQLGGGVEFRLSKHVALDLEARAFLRTRTDDAKNIDPEFLDAGGRVSNTSAAGVLTGGMTFYF